MLRRGHKCLGLLIGLLVSPGAMITSSLVCAENERPTSKTSAGAGQSNSFFRGCASVSCLGLPSSLLAHLLVCPGTLGASSLVGQLVSPGALFASSLVRAVFSHPVLAALQCPVGTACNAAGQPG